MIETLTFALAMVGYAGLTATAIVSGWRRVLVPFWRVTAAVIILHVFLVWHARYEWQLAVATRNGYAGFVIFHAALAAVVASTLAPEPRRSHLVRAAFLVVTAGATGAVFRYEVVAVYRIPVLACATAGLAALAIAWWRGQDEGRATSHRP